MTHNDAQFVRPTSLPNHLNSAPRILIMCLFEWLINDILWRGNHVFAII